MIVTVSSIKEIIEDSLILLRKNEDESNSYKLISKLESVRSILTQNEKKIWLRTKKGLDMLLEVNEAVKNLVKVLDSATQLDSAKTSIDEIELLVRAIAEESRKRNMVVT